MLSSTAMLYRFQNLAIFGVLFFRSGCRNQAAATVFSVVSNLDVPLDDERSHFKELNLGSLPE